MKSVTIDAASESCVVENALTLVVFFLIFVLLLFLLLLSPSPLKINDDDKNCCLVLGAWVDEHQLYN
jgi:hypothetical protein